MIYFCNAEGHGDIPALYSCTCNGVWHYLCFACGKVHFDLLSNKEFLQCLSIESIPHYEASRALKFQISLLENISKELFEDLVHTTRSITDKYNRFSIEIMKMKKELVNDSYLLLNNPQALKEGELKRKYNSNPNDTYALINNFAIIKKEHNILNIHEQINNWFSIELDFSLLDENKSAITISSALDSKNQNIQCNNFHYLNWGLVGLFRIFLKKRGKLFVKCNFCKQKLSKACWNCPECLYFVCKECARKKGLQSRSLKCVEHHELVWKCDVLSYYNYFFNLNKENWKCDVCNVLKVNAHWHCESCTFDICESCILNLNYSSWSVPLISFSGNFYMKIELVDGKSITCFLCKESIITDYYIDPYLNYSVCQKCAVYSPDESPGHPIISCSNFHILRWTKKLGYKCNLCRVNDEGYVFYCFLCKYYMCSKCSRFLENNLINKKDFFSSACITNSYDKENHLLKWTKLKSSIKQQIICNYCRANVNIDTTLLECYECKLYVCINCISKFTQGRSELRNK